MGRFVGVEQINESGHSVDDYAIGDFDGDRRSDIFFANGSQWFVWYGAVAPFVPYATSSYRVGNLRFGDFDGDKKTDVFGVVSGQWSIVPGGTSTWMPLRRSLEDNVSRLVVGDFDGDGRADVVNSQNTGLDIWIWRISQSGLTGWTTITLPTVRSTRLQESAVLTTPRERTRSTWGLGNPRALDIVSSAIGKAKRWSEQEMK